MTDLGKSNLWRNRHVCERYATFRIADLLMGIKLVHVQEVLRFQEMTEVPLSPAEVCGLINLRGEIVAALDVRQILGLSTLSKEKPLPMNIVVRSEDGPVSLIVDEIGDVLDVPLESAMPVPENLGSPGRPLIGSVFQLAGGLLLGLDINLLLEGSVDGPSTEHL